MEVIGIGWGGIDVENSKTIACATLTDYIVKLLTEETGLSNLKRNRPKELDILTIVIIINSGGRKVKCQRN